jgi:hypothetical protein
MKLASMNNHEPPMLLSFCLLRCCATNAISSRLSTCICDRKSSSLEPSFSTVLHRERVDKVFWKRSFRLLNPLNQAFHHGSSTSSSITRGASSLLLCMVFKNLLLLRMSHMYSILKSCLTY